MPSLWKVRFLSEKGEACWSFDTIVQALEAAQTFQSYPGASESVLIETPDHRLVPADRLDLLDLPVRREPH